jgi:hypothetical protein
MTTSLSKAAAELAANERAQIELQSKITAKVAAFQTQLSQAQEANKVLRGQMLEAIEANGGQPYEDDNIKVTYVKPAARKGIDLVKLQLEQPDIFDEYQKPVNVKASIRIKVK